MPVPIELDAAADGGEIVRDIAIIGMAGRFPGASDTLSLYEALLAGRDCVGSIPSKRIEETTLPRDGAFMVAGYLDAIDKFDHQLFGLSLGEAQAMGPNLRLALEVVFEAMENSGYGADWFRGTTTGVYAAQTSSDYYQHADEYVSTLVPGNSADFFSAQIGRHFDLTGPTLVVDTACSSALMALHLACQSLVLGDVGHAIVCGSHIHVFPFKREASKLLDVWADDGKSRAFSAQARGMSAGEVVAAVLLKPLAKARRDRDVIHAVIKSTAVNNNAARSSSPSAPDSVSQARVIERAWALAKIDPTTLGFIEAHGSGTKLGDSLEVEAFNRAFRPYVAATRVCPISTIKSNIGHSHAAAGIAGLIKAVLTLKHRTVFPAVHFDEPSPLIDFARSAVYVPREPLELESVRGAPRRVGVHSFGMSGVNAHVVLEEFADEGRADGVESLDREYGLLTISARSDSNLKRMSQRLALALEASQNVRLSDVAFTLNRGRRHQPVRRAIAFESRRGLIGALRASSEFGSVRGSTPALHFVFAPSAPVTPEAIERLAERHEAFRETLRECSTASTSTAAFQYAIYRALVSYGIKPTSVVGIGPGRSLARVVSGKSSLEQALQDWDTVDWGEPATWYANLLKYLGQLTAGTILLELAPGSFLSERASEFDDDFSTVQLVSCRSEPKNDAVLRICADLYSLGPEPDWDAFHGHFPGRKVELPGYEFERTRCWLRETPKARTWTGSEASRDGAFLGLPSTADEFSEIEKVVRACWREVLGPADLSRHSHFFDAGGDSLGATKVVRALNAKFGLRLDFEDVFDFPTLTALASLVREQLGTAAIVAHFWQEVLAVGRVHPSDDFFQLGGHSLLANQVLTRIQREFGVALNFEDFFATPTVAGLASRIEELQRSDPLAAGNSGGTSIPKVAEQDSYELSPAQEHLWVLCQIEGASVAYNIYVYDLLEGPLDRRALGRAVDAVITKHESLRTVFVIVDEEPRQKVITPSSFDGGLHFIDVSQHASPEADAVKAVTTDITTPFDLTRGPLFRASLIRLASERHALCLTSHHLVTDAWSFDILLSELTELYQAFRSGVSPDLGPPKVQYKDYAAWVNRSLNSEGMARHTAYWKEKLGGQLVPVEIPPDHSRPELKSFRGSVWTLKIDRELSEALRTLALSRGSTLFMALVAGLDVLLYRYTGQSDIIVGTPSAVRSHPELEGVVGFCVNLLPIRTQLDAKCTFAEVLAAVKQALVEAQEHQECPFEMIVRQVKPPRDMSRSVLFDIMVVMQNAGLGVRKRELNESLRVREFTAESRFSRYDLTFEFTELPDGLGLEIEYNVDLYTSETVAELGGHFRNLVVEFVRNPAAAVGAVKLRRDHTGSVFPGVYEFHGGPRTLPELVEHRARLAPDAIALVSGDELLTYGALASRIRRLATHLVHKGMCPEKRVGLCMDKGLNLPVSMLAVLQSGASFVPMDPRLPLARLEAIAAAAGVELILGEQKYAELYRGLPVECMSLSGYEGSGGSDAMVAPPLEDSLAYAIFTSGSTGVPKGVGVTHRSLRMLLIAMQQRPGMREGDVLLSVTTPSFDIALLELFLPLVCGGTVVLVDHQVVLQPDSLQRALSEHQPTMLQGTPALYSMLLEFGTSEPMPQRLLCGGDTLPTHLADVLVESGSELWNMYGPTETTIWSLVHPVEKPVASRVPVGLPIPGTSAYLLDVALNPQAAGRPSNLYLGGAGVARGYVRAPDLTAASFLPDPYAETLGARMYNTGDLVRQPAREAALVFLGRRDTQVKVRGFRVELGEIESALCSHPAVATAAAVVGGGHDARESITAYVVPAAGAAPALVELKAYLRERLPEYMVPSTLNIAPNLPLTPNGKVDRRRLSELLPVLTVNPHEFAAPHGEVEQVIAAVWSDLLGGRDVGRNDNFFDLGAHSLLLVKAHARLQRRLSRALPLIMLFQHPTVSALAGALAGAQPGRQELETQARQRGAMTRESLRRQSRQRRRLRDGLG